MLEAILVDARRRARRARADAAEFQELALSRPAARPFAAGLGPRAIVGEIKRRSPSAGSLAPDLDAVAQAKRYQTAGAAAVSVLTDPDHFDGRLDDLRMVAESVSIPVLRKDFLLDEAQVWESRAAGADAVLLIAAVLGDHLGRMVAVAGEAGMDALVEVHTGAEAAAAEEVGAGLVGVNNRDLHTFVTDLGVAEALAPAVQRAGVVTVAESGVSDPAGAARMWALGYDAILVGEALVTAEDPEALLLSLARS